MLIMIKVNEIKLKPCPFCGGVAKVTEDNTIENIPQYQIRCKNISCTIRPKTNWCIDKTEALTHWNTRKPMDNIIEEVARRDPTDGTVKVFSGKEVIDIIKKGGMDND